MGYIVLALLLEIAPSMHYSKDVKNAELVWRERTSDSKFIASVWTCSVHEETARTVLADPCISLVLAKSKTSAEVILRGPETKPRDELLIPGYIWIAIRLQPGVSLKGFSAQRFLNSSLTLPTEATAQFQFEQTSFQFPSFNTAETLIDQLHKLDFISDKIMDINGSSQGLSSRSYARLTKRATGLSPYKLQQIQRIYQATQLLKQGVPVATVAADLDFVDQAHLTRAAKQFLGHTPKELLHLPQTF